MIKLKDSKLYYFTIAGILMASSPCSAFLFPTFDAAEVTNTIKGTAAQVQSVNTTVQSTLSTTQIQQAIGDNIGSISKFSDIKEKAERAKKKIEKQKKRAERLQKMRQKIEKMKQTYDSAKEIYGDAKGMYNEGMDAYKNAADMYGEAQGYYDQAKGYVGEGLSQLENIKDKGAAQAENIANAAGLEIKSAVEEKSEATVRQNVQEKTNLLMPTSEKGLDDKALADLVSDSEFSEGAWSGAVSTEDSTLKSETVAKPSAGLRRPFVREEQAAKMPQAGFVQPKLSVEPNVQQTKPVEGTTEKTLPDMKVDRTFKIRRQVQPAVEPVKLPAAVGEKDGSSEVLKLVPADFSKASEKENPAMRRAFKKTSMSFSFGASMHHAFAQQATELFTGTNDDGKFIYSDIIAEKCRMNFDQVEEGSVEECIKTWVMGLKNKNAVVAGQWHEIYNKARHDHAAADLAMAISQKGYSAAFDTKVADDLENKSGSLTNEREEVSFVGKVNQTNQEIIIRLMEAMVGQAVTEAWNAVEGLDADYYRQQAED